MFSERDPDWAGARKIRALEVGGLSEVYSGSDASLKVGIRHFVTEKMHRPPACAMSGDNNVRMNGSDVPDCLRDDLLEDSTCQMHSSDESVDLVYTGYSSGVSEDIHCARMAAAGFNY